MLPSGLPDNSPSLNAFRQALVDQGFVEGQNIQIDYRFVFEGEEDLLPGKAAELVSLHPAAIVAVGAARVQAVRLATDRIPIVMADVNDPVENNVVSDIRNHGTNLTGVALVSTGLAAKRVQILSEAVSDMARLAILAPPGWDKPDTSLGREWKEIEQTAAGKGIETFVVPAKDEGTPEATNAGIERAILSAVEHKADALYPMAFALFNTRRTLIADLARDHRLPTIYYHPDFVRAGGLLAYGPNTSDQYRRVAILLNRIVTGTPVKELPIELPTRFDFLIGLGTARAIGIEIPPSLIVQATDVVE